MADFLEQRQAVVDACRTLSRKGYLAGTGGNVALRVDAEHFLVTPSATDYATMTASDIAVLRLEDLRQVDGARPASVERGLHAVLLRAKPDRPASVHTHQPIASAVAVLHETLRWPHRTARAELGDHVGLVPYWPSGTGLLVKALSKRLRSDVHAYLMASHGTICSAATLDAAVVLVAEIEAAAAASLRARITANSGLDAGLRTLVLGHLAGIRSKEALS